MQRRPIERPPDPVSLLAKLRETGDAFLLQSAEGPRRLARFSILGFQPQAMLRIDQGEVTLDGASLDVPPSEAMRAAMGARSNQDDEGYPFNGGLVGYIGYEYITHLEDLPRPPEDPQGPGRFPELEMGLFLDGIIYDHERRTCFYFTQEEDRYDQLPLDAAREDPDLGSFKVGEITT
ncbi:MAG: hypothetical protein R3185_04795, partial [Candidatus Thermoplasmatota archaeon]|nr:hypothetical protein [Candidatus Thermoplasmatota archaeon]